MAAVGDVAERNDRPAYVRFKRVAVENKAESLAQGRFVAVDVDYALITPPYSKDCVEIKVKQWRANLEQDVANGRIPRDWADTYIKTYQAWQNGQELPPSGTAIRGWGVISPAQQEMLIRMTVLTVEDLAAINDEGLRRIGMGALELKTKARAWLAQLADKGPLTQEVAALKTENDVLRGSLETMQAQIRALESRLPTTVPAAPFEDGISVDDILPEAEPVKRKRT